MSGVIATIPKYQFSAADGTPLAAGTLTTYLAGTTTLSSTWQDAALTSANTNPIVLDSRGECVLWLDDTKVYKFVLKNAAGVTQWTVDNVSNPSTFLQAGTGAVSTTVQAKLRESVSVKDFGAVGDGITNDTAAIQTAINSFGGQPGTVFFPAGTYVIEAGGTLGGRNYGLILPNNLSIVGQSYGDTILKLKNNANADLVISNRVGVSKNITIKNLTLDGNQANQSTTLAGFNLWLYNVNTCIVENVFSLNPASWGLRIELCSHVVINNIICSHAAASNADGVHFIDTSFVTGSNFDIVTFGDDGFIVEAKTIDITNYALSNIVIRAQFTTVVAGFRGFLLLNDETVSTGAHFLTKMNVSGLVLDTCSGPAINIVNLSCREVHIDAVARDCQTGLKIEHIATAFYSSTANCSFKFTGANFNDYGIYTNTTNGAISDCFLEASIYNPAIVTNAVGNLIGGQRWFGNLRVNYDPSGTKVTSDAAVSFNLSYSNLNCYIIGGTYNARFNSSAEYNNFYASTFINGTVGSLTFNALAINNTFSGGRVDATIVKSTAQPKFSNFIGATVNASVSANMAINADGTYDLVHNLKAAPAYVSITPFTTAAVFASVSFYDSTKVVFTLRNSAGALITTGIYGLYYEVKV